MPLSRSRKRLLLLVAALPVLVVLSALVYMVGMPELEGQPRGFWHAIAWATKAEPGRSGQSRRQL